MKHFGLIVAAITAAVSVGVSALSQQAQPNPSPIDSEIVYLVTGVRTTGLFHRKDCPWLKDAPQHPMVHAEAVKRYFQAHCLCLTGKEGVPPCASPVVPAAQPGAGASAPMSAVPAPQAPPIRSAVPTTTQTPAIQNTARQQCAATTKKGARCSRMAAGGSAYCWQHP